MRRKRQYEEGGRRYTGCWYYIKGDTKVYYCAYKVDGLRKEFRLGTKKEGYTLARCNAYRSDLMSGKVDSPQQKRKQKQKAETTKLSIVFKNYSEAKVSKKYQTDLVKYHKDQPMHSSDTSRMNIHIIPFFKDVDIKTITSSKIIMFEEYLEKKELKPQTIKHALAHMRRLFEFVGLKVDIAMPVVKNTVTEDLTPFQLKRLKQVLTTEKDNPQVADMLLFIMNTGCRPIEVRKLIWDNLSFDRKIIELKGRKGGVDTVIPMNSEAEKILRRQKKSSEFVFPGLNGKMRAKFSRPAKKLASKAGVPDTHRPVYCLRHWYATELIAQGVDIFTVSRLLGHTDVKTTMRYAEARQMALVDAVDKIAAVMGE